MSMQKYRKAEKLYTDVRMHDNLFQSTFFVSSGAGSRTYILAADTQEDMETWMKSITCANYDYMKLMVSELQRQLDDLNSQQDDDTGRVVRNLVDLSVPDSSSLGATASATNQSSQRQNPFGFVNTGSGFVNMDAFGATPFQPNATGGSHKPRTFKEMHEDFGKYIKEKMASSVGNVCNADAPLIDIS